MYPLYVFVSVAYAGIFFGRGGSTGRVGRG